MFLSPSALVLLYLAHTAAGAALNKRTTVGGTAVVHLDKSSGSPQQLASGILYGIPDQQNQIPDGYYTGINFKYSRAGGAQVSGQGWIGSLAGYKTRFQSALDNYQTTRKYGGTFILLPHDIWGADGTQASTVAYPGDNGDWSNYDAYLTQLISDMKANNMIDNVVIDIWNEPDGTAFWNRPQSQYLDLWGRTYYRFKRDLPQCATSGPSYAGAPALSNSWWTNWASFIAKNGSIPTQYSWHMEGGGGDMQSSVSTYQTILNNNGLATNHVVNINEYGVWSEQGPAGSAWWIAQLERVNAYGLRGNWLSGNALHDFMAGLLGKPHASDSSYSYTAGGYWATGSWQVYHYYAKNMTGTRVATDPTSDLRGEVYAVVGSDKVRLLVGSRVATGTFNIELSQLSAVGLPTSGTLQIHTYGFPGSDDHYAELDAPTDLGVYGHPYSGNSVSFPIYQKDVYTAYAFEFSI
ncbi:glycoside hydrolase superfamily [Ilyonectria destructans]|nr:glycoside hydrolase superfamily [Ilyonectria destructans]